MWVLYAGFRDVFVRVVPRAGVAATREACVRCSLRQPLPMYRLQADHRCGLPYVGVPSASRWSREEALSTTRVDHVTRSAGRGRAGPPFARVLCAADPERTGVRVGGVTGLPHPGGWHRRRTVDDQAPARLAADYLHRRDTGAATNTHTDRWDTHRSRCPVAAAWAALVD